MKLTKQKDIDYDFELFKKLVIVMRDDPVLNETIIKMLQMDPFKRRSVLNNWLEQLRLRHASVSLLSALSCLFDDKVAQDLLALINDHKIKT